MYPLGASEIAVGTRTISGRRRVWLRGVPPSHHKVPTLVVMEWVQRAVSRTRAEVPVAVAVPVPEVVTPAAIPLAAPLVREDAALVQKVQAPTVSAVAVGPGPAARTGAP